MSALLAAAISALALRQAWERRVYLTNEWLAGLALPVQLQLTGLEWHPGVIRLTHVILRDAQGRPMGQVDEIHATVSRRALTKGTLEGVKVKGLRWTATPEQWAKLFSSANEAAPAAPPTKPSQPWCVEQVIFEDAQVELTPRPGDHLSAHFSWAGGALAWDPATGFLAEPQRVDFTCLALTTADGGRLRADNTTLVWRWEAGEGLEFSDLQWPEGKLVLTPGLTGFFGRESAPTAVTAEESSPTASADTPAPAWTRLVRARIGQPGQPVHVAWQFPGQVEGHAGFIVEGRDLAWGDGWHLGSTDVHAEHAVIHSAPEIPAWRLEVPLLTFSLQRPPDSPLEFRHVVAEAPRWELTWSEAAPSSSAVPAASPLPPAPATAKPVVVIYDAELRDGHAVLTHPGPNAHAGPLQAEGHVAASLQALTVDSEGRLHSPVLQIVSVTHSRVTGGAHPVAEWEELEVHLIPTALQQDGQIESVRWVQPHLSYRGTYVHAWQTETSATLERPPSVPLATPSTAITPWWQRLRPRAVEVTGGTFTATEWLPNAPELSGRWSLYSPQPESYVATLTEVMLAADRQSLEGPPLRLGKVVLEADADGLARSHVDALRIANANVHIGTVLRRLQPPSAPATSAKAESPAPSALIMPSPCTVGELSLDTTRITIADILPLLDPITFNLSFTLKDVPLSPAGLAAHTQRQKIEVTGLKLHSAYGGTGSLPVAEFPHLFLECSLAGLLEQRLERVEAISPVIYVGEQLFWYIDYFRQEKARAAQTKTVEALNSPSATPAAPPPSWTIGQIEAHFGKMLLALKGSVIDALPALPFTCSTQLDEGRVQLILDIPRDTYRPASGLPLEIDVLEGTASFNYPLQERDNNLVQVFRASELRYKQLRAQDVYLTVTYDQHGAYARFGGKLYGGYLSGGGDIYLDDNVSWDGWLDGRGIALEPLTQALTPEYLTLTGQAQLSLMAYGDTAQLNIATGTVEAIAPGTMTVHGLEALKEKIPHIWSQLERSLAQLSLEAFRDFPYEQGKASLKLYHREGELNLSLRGPRGSRTFHVKLHDHRHTIAQ